MAGRFSQHGNRNSRLKMTTNATQPNTQTPLVLLISMERSTERRERATSALNRLGLNYEWVRAVDGRDLSDDEVAHIRSQQKFSPLSRGQIGCYLSHLKCYRIMRERNLPYALIMEDDMVPDERLLKVLARLDRFPSDWNIITLAPYGGQRSGRMTAFGKPNLIHRKALGDGLYIGKYFHVTAHTCLYLIKSCHIEELEKHLLPMDVAIDFALFDLSFSFDFPYALYEYDDGHGFSWIYNSVEDSEIQAIGWEGCTPTEERKPTNRTKKKFYDLLRKIYYIFDPFVLRVTLNMPWRDANKHHYLKTGYRPWLLRVRIIVWRNCDWRYLPIALVRALLPQRR